MICSLATKKWLKSSLQRRLFQSNKKKNAHDSQTNYGSGIPRTRGFHLLNIASTTGVIKAFIAVFGETREMWNEEEKSVSSPLLPT